MATEQPNEATQFYQFLGEQIGRGTDMTPEDLLDVWRESHPMDDDEELVSDVREALDGIAAGKPCMPAEEFFAKFRRENGIGEP